MVTYPLQVTQSRMRMDEATSSRQNLFAVLREIYEKEKFFGLFKGISAKMTSTVLISALLFAFYEAILKRVAFFNNNFGGRRQVLGIESDQNLHTKEL